MPKFCEQSSKSSDTQKLCNYFISWVTVSQFMLGGQNITDKRQWLQYYKITLTYDPAKLLNSTTILPISSFLHLLQFYYKTRREIKWY
jgi:hypothetical protein